MSKRSTRIGVLIAVAVVILVVLAIGILVLGYFSEAVRTGVKGKKLWDWLDLLIVPAILVVAGAWISYKLEEHAQDREQHQANERELDAELQNYFDQMQRLVIHENLRDVKNADEANADEARDFAAGRTKALLKDLDATRKRRLLTFLYESHLIDTSAPVVCLSGADFSDAKLRHASLKDADLRGANLASADLHKANLISAKLDGADLDGADLDGADLDGADLDGSKGVTGEQLAACKSLKGATITDDQKYEDWLETPEGQDWLNKYKKGRAEDGENNDDS